MSERPQRALDELDCAQVILDAAGGSRHGDSSGEVSEQVSEALRMFAGRWPQEYPEGAVERMLVSPSTPKNRRLGASRTPQVLAHSCRYAIA
jgi:hypothetical protein